MKDDSDPLIERLKALGVRVESKPAPELPPAVRQYPIEQVVAGQNRSTIYGDAFFTSTQFKRDYRHGELDLYNFPSLEMISEWGKASALGSLAPNEIIFLDTETSGLAGGTGTFAFLIGLGRHTLDGFEVVQFFMRDPSQETALLAALDEFLSPFRAVVTFNGKTFDLPLLNTRFTLNGLTSPFGRFEHIDLLHLARRIWRDRLPSRALSDLEKEIAGFTRAMDEVPGYLIPQYYFDYLRTQDARPLKGVFYHNVIDITSLAALFNYTAGLIAAPLESSTHALDLAAIARLFEDLGHLEQAAALYERCLAEGLPKDSYLRSLERFAAMRKRQGRADLAVKLWELAAGQNHLPAFIELVKYYEHISTDYELAVEWVNRALETIGSTPLPGYLRKMYLDEFTHRLERLHRKRARMNR